MNKNFLLNAMLFFFNDNMQVNVVVKFHKLCQRVYYYQNDVKIIYALRNRGSIEINILNQIMP